VYYGIPNELPCGEAFWEATRREKKQVGCGGCYNWLEYNLKYLEDRKREYRRVYCSDCGSFRGVEKHSPVYYTGSDGKIKGYWE